MFKLASIGKTVVKTTLQKIAPATKTIASTGSKMTLGLVKLPLTSLLKLSSSMMPMIGSALLGSIYLLIKLIK